MIHTDNQNFLYSLLLVIAYTKEYRSIIHTSNLFSQITVTQSVQNIKSLYVYGVGKKKAAMQAASHNPNAALHAAKAGEAAITAPGTVPKVKPAAAKQATVTPAQPA